MHDAMVSYFVNNSSGGVFLLDLWVMVVVDNISILSRNMLFFIFIYLCDCIIWWRQYRNPSKSTPISK